MKQVNIKQIIITVVVVTLASMAGKFGVDYFMNRGNSIDSHLMKAASELNRNCPIMVDQYTRLDNAIALPDRVFQYNYSLVNHVKDEVNVEEVRKSLSPAILNNIRSNEQLSTFRDNGVTMKYAYKDKNGVFIFSMEFKPEDYR